MLIFIVELKDKSNAADIELFYSSITSMAVAIMADKSTSAHNTRTTRSTYSSNISSHSVPLQHTMDRNPKRGNTGASLAQRPASTDPNVHRENRHRSENCMLMLFFYMSTL